MSGPDGSSRSLKFLRNGDPEPADLDWSNGIETARQAISEAMNAKNIAFLLGAGCSWHCHIQQVKAVQAPWTDPLRCWNR